MDYAKQIAIASLNIEAIKLNLAYPFTWASGLRMPIYNDNRKFLFYPEYRKLIAESFEEILKLERIDCDVIAGTSTAGISPATTLADILKKPLIYIRNEPKGHGLKNQIEGIGAESDLKDKTVILVEDLISTGGSSASAVKVIRDANGKCNYCISIFNYGLNKAVETFNSLDPACEVRSLLTYDKLLEVAKETGQINEDQVKMLSEWRADPFNWGEKQGFKRVEE